MDLTLFASQEVDQFDALAFALEACPDSVTVSTGHGEPLALPVEVVRVLQQAAELLARGKAVTVTPQSRARFA